MQLTPRQPTMTPESGWTPHSKTSDAWHARSACDLHSLHPWRLAVELCTPLKDSQAVPCFHACLQVGDLERKTIQLARKPEDDYWGEEAGRRCV